MKHYEDDAVLLDDDGIVIHDYRFRGDSRRIPYDQIQDYEVFETSFWTGRHRLVGLPLGRPRNWFHWNRNRRGRSTAIGFDVGRWIHPTIVPEDVETVTEHLDKLINR